MSANWNYPDGVNPNMVPGNSLAAEHFQRHWDASSIEVARAAREKLLLAVRVYGPTRDGYLDHRAEHGLCTPEQYVAYLERSNDWCWVRTVDNAWHEQLSAEADSAGEAA